MALSDKIVKQYKIGVDAAGIVNEADVAILANTSLQNKCLFEILIYPQTFPTSVKGLALAALELLVLRTYVYAIEEMVLTGVEYQRSGGVQWVKDLIYPESVTFTFLETGLGTVKNYLRTWMDTIATLQPTSLKVGSIWEEPYQDYVFSDNQKESKRNAIIMPLQSDMLPSPEWIHIEGMKFKQVGGISYDQSNGENEIISVTFSCDSIYLKSAV